jgi:hypothetical protein
MTVIPALQPDRRANMPGGAAPGAADLAASVSAAAAVPGRAPTAAEASATMARPAPDAQVAPMAAAGVAPTSVSVTAPETGQPATPTPALVVLEPVPDASADAGELAGTEMVAAGFVRPPSVWQPRDSGDLEQVEQIRRRFDGLTEGLLDGLLPARSATPQRNGR